MLKLLWINKSLHIIHQKRNVVKYVKYCSKPNEKVLTDKMLYFCNFTESAMTLWFLRLNSGLKIIKECI